MGLTHKTYRLTFLLFWPTRISQNMIRPSPAVVAKKLHSRPAGLSSACIWVNFRHTTDMAVHDVYQLLRAYAVSDDKPCCESISLQGPVCWLYAQLLCQVYETHVSTRAPSLRSIKTCKVWYGPATMACLLCLAIFAAIFVKQEWH